MRFGPLWLRRGNCSQEAFRKRINETAQWTIESHTSLDSAANANVVA
jgi:hypothetical protein